ncbi:MAG: pilus assembly protein [Devosiaceae bacterium]|nr:pilus assembly protein [Devosiaceae bacterium MH13]
MSMTAPKDQLSQTTRSPAPFGILRIAQSFKRFRSDRRGIAATEFALIAPFMLALWLGSIELSQAVAIDRKVSHASSALADLVTQQANLTNAEIDDIMDATTAILSPYNVGNLSIEMVGLNINASSDVEVTWSVGRNRSVPSIGDTYEVPAALVLPDTFLVAARLFYDHTPATMHVFTGSVELSDAFFLRPRRSAEITISP